MLVSTAFREFNTDAAMSVPCSVKTRGRYFRWAPRPVSKVAKSCDFAPGRERVSSVASGSCAGLSRVSGRSVRNLARSSVDLGSPKRLGLRIGSLSAHFRPSACPFATTLRDRAPWTNPMMKTRSVVTW